jgi:phosphatidylserine decarboxylase
MKHSGKAFRAAGRIIVWTLVLLLAVIAAGVIATFVGGIIATVATTMILVWIFFALFTLYFFRDPDALSPAEPNAIVAPAHGKVDVIDETTEGEVLGGRCRRISIFLSIFNVHVQNAPITGRVIHLKHREGKFLSATKADSARFNENVLLGFEPPDAPERKVGVRLIAGIIARRIIPWCELGETVSRSERIGLIQFGSRCELYLPLNTRIHAKLGDKVRGGETVVASYE